MYTETERERLIGFKKLIALLWKLRNPDLGKPSLKTEEDQSSA